MRLPRADVEAQLARTLMRDAAKDTVLSGLKDGLPEGAVVVPSDPVWLPAGWATIQRPVLPAAKPDAGAPVAKPDAGAPVAEDPPAKAPQKDEIQPQKSTDAGPPADEPPAAKAAAEENP